MKTNVMQKHFKANWIWPTRDPLTDLYKWTYQIIEEQIKEKEVKKQFDKAKLLLN